MSSRNWFMWSLLINACIYLTHSFGWLTLSWRRLLSYRNQSIELRSNIYVVKELNKSNWVAALTLTWTTNLVSCGIGHIYWKKFLMENFIFCAAQNMNKTKETFCPSCLAQLWHILEIQTNTRRIYITYILQKGYIELTVLIESRYQGPGFLIWPGFFLSVLETRNW